MWYFTYFDHYYVTGWKKNCQRISEIFSIIRVGVETYSKQSMASLQRAYMRLCYYYIIQILCYFDHGWENVAQKLWNILIHTSPLKWVFRFIFSEPRMSSHQESCMLLYNYWGTRHIYICRIYNSKSPEDDLISLAIYWWVSARKT